MPSIISKFYFIELKKLFFVGTITQLVSEQTAKQILLDFIKIKLFIMTLLYCDKIFSICDIAKSFQFMNKLNIFEVI